MQIEKKHLAGKPKKIGTLDGDSVVELATTGGLHLVAIARGGKTEILGAGPHRAIARHIAQKKEPSMVLSELSKADHVPYEVMEPLLEKYEEETAYLRYLQGV